MQTLIVMWKCENINVKIDFKANKHYWDKWIFYNVKRLNHETINFHK